MSTKDIVVYTTFEDFYPFYLKEHTNRTNRRLHFVGTTLALLTFFSNDQSTLSDRQQDDHNFYNNAQITLEI
ncbi:hypothetical protein PPL_00084 [Heterostelium album PN500]|uniref:Uncharacterized protein n=1 Tax=Heterostelium pallidum (strain ATCC 26659 / Pp 5 / PN500) TaxID=670386 RepID=D3AVH3_HETP5|nr:hypothetical protein PPL_00084 [Heterostelium album PN500]EFA86296.1 hypothetical protein PPL_00084 [Heterostelium album PN500]|eukprot:XP_020438401.1 hypothetical protein PPL_00084 [Heterostelium album PN500]